MPSNLFRPHADKDPQRIKTQNLIFIKYHDAGARECQVILPAVWNTSLSLYEYQFYYL
jgi:hypothetical protein